MFFILTDAGQAAISGSQTPPVLTLFSFGSGYNYTPISTQTALHGSAVFSGVPSLPIVAGPNLLRYTAVVDSSVGNFQYGELGLYLPGGQLFAIGADTALTNKNDGNGNNLVIDCYIPLTGANYDPYTYISNSANALNILVAGSLDSLPVASSSQTNIFIAPSRVNPTQSSHLAFALNGLWSVQGYSAKQATGVATSSGVTVTVSSWNTAIPTTAYAGQLLFQPLSGPNAGTIRVISTIVNNVITLENGYTSPMVSGNTFEILGHDPTYNDAKLKQDALKDATNVALAGGSQVPTVAQANALIATALSSIPAANLTGLVPKLITDATGNAALNQLTNAFGTPLGRILPA